MVDQVDDAFISQFIQTGNQLYNSGQYTDLVGFCNEILEVVSDEQIHAMLARAESAIKFIDDNNMTRDDIVIFPLESGITITGYKNEYIMNTILQSKDYYECKLLKSWFGSGVYKTVFDIGANIGNHTLFFAANSPEAEVYAFEPMKINYKLLEKNINNNKLSSRVHLYNNAVGLLSGKAHMKTKSDNNNGTAHIVEEDDPNTETVEIIVIDELDLPVPDFIKIDTEGYEVQVLQGMRKTLEKSNAFIWIELDTENAIEVYRLMDSLDYEVIDYHIISNNNVLFGKKTQDVYPKGYGFARLLEWARHLSDTLEKLLVTPPDI